jgi:hypothetical protein
MLTGGEAHDITGVDELLAAWDRLPLDRTPF